ncbi:hypothetical protein BOTBODRAFT_39395 [Botryobasidium botryosum FD-172 SS1]|uniref:Shr3 amino acid permease chaperone n=1 Tax=Botryobasidium botryosum (strain FD-172 SS1) TaxID=930990 RepID=A0A067LWR6_BOTB1|nr:hypothetical protein BOTBODRAFT_39395 [Botryobasidium botryosum FD-172 SS1]
MGIRTAAVLCTTSFLLGNFLTHWIADYITLWQNPLTEEHLRTSAAYYFLLSTMPDYMLWIVSAVGALGGISIVASLWDGEAGNIMFDGASIFLYISALGVYWGSIYPILSDPNDPLSTTSSSATLQISTIKLASASLKCSVALTGVIVLQAARWWAAREDREEDEKIKKEQ